MKGKQSWVQMFADGACINNPGPGGYAALLIYNGREKIIKGGEPATTNNRMEMQAIIAGLEALTRQCKVAIYTDSQYVHKGITQYIEAWRKNYWRTANNKPIKNLDLWRKIDNLADQHELIWNWVYGHGGHPQHDRVDEIARKEARIQAALIGNNSQQTEFHNFF